MNGSSADSDESRLLNPLTMSTLSTRNNSISMASSIYSHPRSLPGVVGNSLSLREYRGKRLRWRQNLINEMRKFLSFTEPEHSINIPSYIIRGAGKQTHYEYEIRIFLRDDRWVLLRRYSRFRELHLSMRAKYGEKVSVLLLLTWLNFNFLSSF